MREHTLFATKTKGIGFELPICRRLIEAYEWRILVKSQAVKGANFVASTPMNDEMDKTRISL
jgi:K+-sensing histidine kinase KdpD